MNKSGVLVLLLVCVYICIVYCALPAPPNPVANPKSTITFHRARFTVLSPTLIRMESIRENSTQFDDRPSLVVQNRYFPNPPPFTVSYPNSTAISIKTQSLTLVHNAVYPANISTCFHVRNNTDQSGGQRVPDHPNHLSLKTSGDCCKACDYDTYCSAWVFEPPSSVGANGYCWLMMNVKGTINNNNRIFGEANKNIFTDSNLQVQFTGGNGPMVWRPSTVNKNNLHGTLDAMDCYSTPTQCNQGYNATWHTTEGILSKDGWWLMDDSITARLEANQTIDNKTKNYPIPWFIQTYHDLEDWYLFVTPNLHYQGTLKDFASIAGGITVPPRSALGVWWSRYYPYTAQEFTEQILWGYANYTLPLSHVVFDMDWHIEPNSPGCQPWGGYTFNKTNFPQPAEYINWLHSTDNPIGRSLKVLLNIHPQTGVDHCQDHYAEFATLNGVNPATLQAVPCDFGNYTFTKTLYEIYLNAHPLNTVSYWWTDYPGCGGPNNDATSDDRSMFWSNYVFDTYMQYLYSRNTSAPTVRPLVLSRYGGLGNHRYPIGFSGDTFQAFQTLRWEIEMTPSAANVLFGWWSHDIGGFHTGDECPGDGDPTNITGSELLLRWLQFGAVAPIFRTHCDHCERRIWVFTYHFYWMRHAMYLRNGFVPYTYTFAKRRAYQDGVSLVHPVYYEWPNRAESYDWRNTEYMFGDRILASPIGNPTMNSTSMGNVVEHATWLPPVSWSDWNGTVVYDGGNEVVTQLYGWQDIPLFVRTGTVLPLQSNNTFASANFADPLVWTIFPAGESSPKGEASVEEDDGNSLDYQFANGTAVTDVQYTGGSDQALTVVKISPTVGSFAGMPQKRGHVVQLRGVTTWQSTNPKVTVNGVSVPQGRGEVPGWWISDEYGLVITEGALVVNAGVFSVSDSVVVSIQF